VPHGIPIENDTQLSRNCPATSTRVQDYFYRLTTSWQGTKAPKALSSTNVFRLETAGIAIVCLVYLDANGPAHMRYSVRRLRRKLPGATIMLCCWAKDIDREALELLREGAKACASRLRL
jgi:hypothetical protein